MSMSTDCSLLSHLICSVGMLVLLSSTSSSGLAQYSAPSIQTDYSLETNLDLPPALMMPLQQEQVAAQRASRRKTTVIFWMLSGIGTRVASRNAYSNYLEATTAEEAEQKYFAANTLHQLSFGCFGLAGIQWATQISGKRKKP